MSASIIFERLLNFFQICYEYLMDFGESVFLFFGMSLNSALDLLVPNGPDLPWAWADYTIAELVLAFLVPTVLVLWIVHFFVDKLTPWD